MFQCFMRDYATAFCAYTKHFNPMTHHTPPTSRYKLNGIIQFKRISAEVYNGNRRSFHNAFSMDESAMFAFTGKPFYADNPSKFKRFIRFCLRLSLAGLIAVICLLVGFLIGYFLF